jgi:hypothetical protein
MGYGRLLLDVGWDLIRYNRNKNRENEWDSMVRMESAPSDDTLREDANLCLFDLWDYYDEKQDVPGVRDCMLMQQQGVSKCFLNYFISPFSFFLSLFLSLGDLLHAREALFHDGFPNA